MILINEKINNAEHYYNLIITVQGEHIFTAGLSGTILGN